MVEIFDAVRFDSFRGTATLHRGTKEYMERLQSTILDKSGREVPDHHVDAAGKYLVKDTDDHRT